jgi:hypothetical protein
MTTELNEFFNHIDFSKLPILENESSIYFTIIATDTEKTNFALVDNSDLIHIGDYEQGLERLFTWYYSKQEANDVLQEYLSKYKNSTNITTDYNTRILTFSICEVLNKIVVVETEKITFQV